MAWINGLERKRFNEEQKRLAEQYRAAGMTEEQIEQMYQFDLVEFNSRRRFSEHTQQFQKMFLRKVMMTSRLFWKNISHSSPPVLAFLLPVTGMVGSRKLKSQNLSKE